MPRPCCLRHIGFKPTAGFFKPAGVPACALEQVTLTLDEVEALRLADLNGLYQEQAAEKMKISRPTFSRIVEEARRKVADALIHGKALRLEGGAVRMKGETEMPGRDGTGPVGPRAWHGAWPVRLRTASRPDRQRAVRDSDGAMGARSPSSVRRRRMKVKHESETEKGEQKS